MTLHPFYSALIAKNVGAQALSSGTPEQARELVAAGRTALGEGPSMAAVADVEITSRGGSLAGRLLIPTGEVHGAIVYLHGGGWAVGSIDDYMTLGRELAARTNCAVLLPEYRLAPEHPFPAGLEDTEDAIEWMASSMKSHLGRSVPLVVAGDSAGGNLATVALRRLHTKVEAVLQVLVYPVTDSQFDTDSYRLTATGLPLTREDMLWFFSLYAPQTHWPDQRISPLRADNLSAYPPTLIVTAEYDVLRSDGELYARMLEAAGVRVEYRQYPGMVHGFLRLHNHIDVSNEALADIAGAINSALTST
jgi:acetyl esterase